MSVLQNQYTTTNHQSLWYSTMNYQQGTQLVAVGENRNQQVGSALNLEGITNKQPRFYDRKAKEIDLQSIFEFILRYKYVIALTALACLFLSYLYVKTLTPQYRATSTIKIELQGDKLAKFDGAMEDQGSNPRSFITQQNLLTSHKLASRILTKLALEENILDVTQREHSDDTSFLNKAKTFFSSTLSDIAGLLVDDKSNTGVEKLGIPPEEMRFIKGITVEQVRGSNLIKVHYTSSDPEKSALYANLLSEEFVSMNLEGKSTSSSYAKDYLEDQIELAKKRLEDSENKLNTYAKEQKIISTDSEKGTLISNELTILNDAYATAQNELIIAESNYRKRAGSSLALSVMDNGTVSSLRDRIGSLESDYQAQLMIYKPGYPKMVTLKKQINELKHQLKAATASVRTNTSDDLKNTYLAAKEKETNLAKKLEEKKSKLLAQRDKGVGYFTLQREVETNKKLYDSLLQRMREIGIASGVVSNNISIVDKAYVPYTKFSPNTKKSLMIGSLLGLILGVGISLLLFSRDDRFRSVEELEELTGLPMLGVFPFIKQKNKKDGALLLEKDHRIEMDAFSSIVTNLEYIDSKGLPKILHITSAAPSEGKSNTSINISKVIAQHHKSVLIIDADLRKPKVAQYLKHQATNNHGLSDYLTGKVEIDEIIESSNMEGVQIIKAGRSVPNPAQLLADESFLNLLEYAAENFDHIVIDSPPVLGLADALILANRSTATVFAVASNQSRREQVKDALKRLELGYGNVIGFVWTKAKSTKKDYYSYHQHYYGYHSDNRDLELVES